MIEFTLFIHLTHWGREKNGCSFADDTFKRIFLTENVWIAIKIPLKFVPKGPINNNPALVQIMAWRRPGDKPLSEPMMVRLPMHICVTQPQWVKIQWISQYQVSFLLCSAYHVCSWVTKCWCITVNDEHLEPDFLLNICIGQPISVKTKKV